MTHNKPRARRGLTVMELRVFLQNDHSRDAGTLFKIVLHTIECVVYLDDGAIVVQPPRQFWYLNVIMSCRFMGRRLTLTATGQWTGTNYQLS